MILTVDQLREHITTDLGDDALQRLLDAAEEAIIARAGASGSREELAGGGGRFISLALPADSITSVVESDGYTITTLAADDYRLYTGGLLLERLSSGTNPRSTWNREVTTTYVPVDNDATRMLVQIELCELAISYRPGLAEETIGEWTERFLQNSAWNASAERDAILAKLDVDLGMVVIG